VREKKKPKKLLMVQPYYISRVLFEKEKHILSKTEGIKSISG